MSKYRWVMRTATEQNYDLIASNDCVVKTIFKKDDLWCYGSLSFTTAKGAQRYALATQKMEDEQRAEQNRIYEEQQREHEFSNRFATKFKEITGITPQAFVQNKDSTGKVVELGSNAISSMHVKGTSGTSYVSSEHFESQVKALKRSMATWQILFFGCLLTCLLLAIYVSTHCK